MKKSKDERVQNFLQDMLSADEEQFEILQNLRTIVFDLNPKTEERMMYGGIMFSLKESDFGGIFASNKHVSFEFSHGHKMKDPKKLLEGTGKFRRHLKIKSISEIKGKEVKFFVRQATTHS